MAKLPLWEPEASFRLKLALYRCRIGGLRAGATESGSFAMDRLVHGYAAALQSGFAAYNWHQRGVTLHRRGGWCPIYHRPCA